MNEKQLKIDYFRGVDFASLDIDAAPSRGTRGSKNFWRTDNGEFKKRDGWKQAVKKLDGKINGIFPFQTGGNDYLLVFTDKNAWRVKITSNGYDIDNVEYPEPNSDAYYKYRAGSGTSATGSTDRVYAPVYDSTNDKLTNLADRKISAVTDKNGNIYLCAGAFYVYVPQENSLYELRQHIDFDADTSDKINVERGKIACYLGSRYITIPTTVTQISEDGSFDVLDAKNLFSGLHSEHFLVSSNGFYPFKKGFGSIDSTQLIATNHWLDISNPPTGASVTVSSTGITVSNMPADTIATYIVAGYGENNPTFNPGEFTAATEYGLAGYSDRMFGAIGNTVYYSEMDNYTYFANTSTIRAGSPFLPIKGFLRLADQALAVFKEAENDEGSIHYVGGRESIEYDSNGNIKKITPIFSITPGASKEVVKNAFCTANFAGDSVFVSDTGVYGIELTENIQTNVHVAKQRSKLIGNALRDSGTYSCIPFGNRLFVSDGAGNVYVADARQRWRENENEPMQYEWYYWDNIPARIWCATNDKLYFGTDDGRICMMFSGRPYDSCFEETTSGEVTDVQGEKITAAENSAIWSYITQSVENRSIWFPASADNIVIKERTWVPPEEREHETDDCPFNDVEVTDAEMTSSGAKYYIPKSSALKVGDKLTTDDERFSTNGPVFTITYRGIHTSSTAYFKLDKAPDNISNGDQFSVTFTKVKSLDVTHEYEIRNVDTTNINFEIADKFGSIEFVANTSDLMLLLFSKVPFSAKWYTPTFNLGADDYRKTLTRLTVSTGDNSKGVLRFGWNTGKTTTYGTKTLPQFSFADIDFDRLTFRSDNYYSHTIRAHDRGFIYIRFLFSSEDEGSCAINGITATYRITNENRGLR